MKGFGAVGAKIAMRRTPAQCPCGKLCFAATFSELLESPKKDSRDGNPTLASSLEWTFQFAEDNLSGKHVWTCYGQAQEASRRNGHGSKPMVPFCDRRATHFRTYFSGWIGMFTGGTGFGIFTHGQMVCQNPGQGCGIKGFLPTSVVLLGIPLMKKKQPSLGSPCCCTEVDSLPHSPGPRGRASGRNLPPSRWAPGAP